MAISETITSWETELGRSYRSAEDLLRAGLIKTEDVDQLAPVLDKYRFLLPRYYAGLIDKDDFQARA